MSDINNCTFTGRLGADPELRYTGSEGRAVASFSIAVGESWKDSKGEKQERTTWVRCVAWAKLAEVCGEYLKKGQQVAVRGKLQIRQYEKDGDTRYAAEVVIDQMTMIGGKREEGDAPREERPRAKPKSPPAKDPYGFDDDVPF